MKNQTEKIKEAFICLVKIKKSSVISITDICDKADISRTTFYKYFKDKYDIIESIFMNDVVCPLETVVKFTSNANFILENWYINFHKNKEFYCIIIRDEGQNSLLDTMINKLTQINIKILSSYIVDPTDLEYISYKYAATQALLLKKWMLEGMKVEPQKMAAYYVDGKMTFS